MAKQAGTAKTGNTSKVIEPKTKAQHRPEQKAEIVKKINNLFAGGAVLSSACDALGISHKTFWVWRNETEELRADYDRANMERHTVRAERLKEVAYSALEHLMTFELRERTIKEGIPGEDGEMKIKKIVQFQEFKDPQMSAVKAALEAYAADEFKKEEGPKTITVTFTDDAQHGFSEPGEPETEQ